MSTRLRKDDYRVRPLSHASALDFIERHHYTQGASNTATFAFGLYRCGSAELMGAAMWIPPTKGAAIATFPEGDWREVLALSRLAVHPDVPTNGESFLIGRSIRRIKQSRDWRCLVTYADEGQGHEGTIYEATNWEFVGRTKPEIRWVDSDGRHQSRKRGNRTLTNAEMAARGYVNAGAFRKKKFRMVLNVRRKMRQRDLLEAAQ